MQVVISHGTPSITVYGPFVDQDTALKWGDTYLGENNPFWSVEPVESELIIDDPNAVSNHSMSFRESVDA